MWFLYTIDRRDGYRYLIATANSLDEIHKYVEEFSPSELVRYSLKIERESRHSIFFKTLDKK